MDMSPTMQIIFIFDDRIVLQGFSDLEGPHRKGITAAASNNSPTAQPKVSMTALMSRVVEPFQLRTRGALEAKHMNTLVHRLDDYRL